MIQFEIKIENGLEYCVVHFTDLSHIDYDELSIFQNEHEYNKVIIDTNGIFYNHFQLFHNDFGPSMIMDDTNAYHINGNRLTKIQFERRLKLKQLKNKKLYEYKSKFLW